MALKFFFTMLFTILLLSHAVFAYDMINDTCKTITKGDPNIHYDFCTTSFGWIPKSHYANLRGLGRISINLTKSNATHTITHIKWLLKNKKMGRYVRSCLMDCAELYTEAVSSLSTGFEYFKHKKYYEANIEVSAAMEDATTCEDGFKERKGVVSPLTKRNNDMFQLGAVALGVINICP